MKETLGPLQRQRPWLQKKECHFRKAQMCNMHINCLLIPCKLISIETLANRLKSRRILIFPIQKVRTILSAYRFEISGWSKTQQRGFYLSHLKQRDVEMRRLTEILDRKLDALPYSTLVCHLQLCQLLGVKLITFMPLV